MMDHSVPNNWNLVLSDDEGEVADLCLVRQTVSPRYESTAQAYWKKQLEPFGKAEFPKEEIRIRLPAFPSLDEAWTLFMWIRANQVSELPESWRAMCEYVADVRQGLWPDRVLAQHAVQSVYLVLAQQCLGATPPKYERFLDEALGLLSLVAQKLEDGGRLLDDEIVAAEPSLEKYVSLLVKDRELYVEDLNRADRYLVTMPGEHDPTGEARTLPMLVLRRPLATQFKVWARTDPKAPGGNGYKLLLVAFADGAIVLSADPTSKAKVGWLAEGLTAKERAIGYDDAVEWYDGRDHEGTLVAAPLPKGSKLPFDEVVAELSTALSAKAPPKPKENSRKVPMGYFVAALVPAIAAVAWLAWPTTTTKTREPAVPLASDPSEQTRHLVAPAGEPLSEAETESVVALFHSKSIDEAPRRFALLAGVCGYASESLTSPCKDARAMEKLLSTHYGYRPEDIQLLVDDSAPGDSLRSAKIQKPTLNNLHYALEKFGALHQRSDTSLLFYFSGHGVNRSTGQKEWGFLLPLGALSKEGAKLADKVRGWNMAHIASDIQDQVRSRHIMVILDSCRAGFATEAKGDEVAEKMMSNWDKKAQVVIAAAGPKEKAWSDTSPDGRWNGLSAMTKAIVQGMTPSKEGETAADTNKDGVITDSELAEFVHQQTLALVNAAKLPAQHTKFKRLDTGAAERGQFLFVPSQAK